MSNTLFYMCMYKYSPAYLICHFIYEASTVAWSLYIVLYFLVINNYGPDIKEIFLLNRETNILNEMFKQVIFSYIIPENKYLSYFRIFF